MNVVFTKTFTFLQGPYQMWILRTVLIKVLEAELYY